MTQKARPAADVSNEGWAPTPVYAQIDEAVPDDETFVAAAPCFSEFTVRLSRLAAPVVGPGEVAHALTLRLAGPATVLVELLQGDTLIAWDTFTPGATFAPYTLTLSRKEAARIRYEPGPGGDPDLRVRVTAVGDCGSGSGPYTCAVTYREPGTFIFIAQVDGDHVIECWGGGGGGGQSGSITPLGGGGGGSYARRTVSLTAGTSYTVTVGARGIPGFGAVPPGGTSGFSDGVMALLAAPGGVSGAGGGAGGVGGSGGTTPADVRYGGGDGHVLGGGGGGAGTTENGGNAPGAVGGTGGDEDGGDGIGITTPSGPLCETRDRGAPAGGGVGEAANPIPTPGCAGMVRITWC